MSTLTVPIVKNGQEAEQEERIYNINDFPYSAALEAPISTKDKDASLTSAFET